MSGSKARRKNRRSAAASSRCGATTAIILALSLSLIVTGGIFAQLKKKSGDLQKRKPTDGVVGPASLNPQSPSKEMIYGPGGKLLATEEPIGVSCTYLISPPSASFGASGGSGSVSVSTGTGCSWIATSNASWITITSGSSGTGNGTVNYSAAANTGAARTGTITIAGLTFTTNQDAGASSSGPVGYWRFDEGSGLTAADSSGNGSAGTLMNGPTWTAGRINSALSFDGANDYVQVGARPSLIMTTALAVSSWVYPSGSGIVVNKEGEYEIAIWPDGHIFWAFANTNPGWAWIDTGYPVPFNQWTHIAVVYSSGTVKTYANGSLVNTYFGSGAIGDVDPGQNDFRIGGRQCCAQYFTGRIDEVRAYNRALSDAEVQTLFNEGGPPPLYEGWHDGADCNTIFGWAADRNRLNTSINVDIYDGATFLATVPANQLRSDVGAYLGDNGYHGFSYATPASLRDGLPHSIYVKFSGTGINLSGTPRSITCGAPIPNAPSNLNATAQSSSQINLTWTDNSNNETGFKLERKTGAGGIYSQIATLGANITSYSDTGLSASTNYYYRVRAYNSGGDSAYSNEASATTGSPGGSGTGLKGEYFANVTLTGPATVTRVDPTINFTWGTGSPDPAIPIDQFSVLWTGQVQAQFSETYTFYVFSDDGVRLWVNGQLLLDRWFDQYGPEVASAPIALTAGQRYDIRIEYYEAFGGAELHVSWASPSTPKQVVPQSQLYPPAAAGSYSLSLNGAGAYVSVPDSNSLDITSPFTVEAWIKTNTPSAAQQGIVERYRATQGVQDGGFALRLSNGKLQFWSLKNGWDLVDMVEGNSIIPSGWHHVAGVWDGSELRVYIDGVLNGFKASTYAPAPETMNLKIGARGDDAAYPFNGLIDEVRITAAPVYTGQSFTVERQLSAVAGTRALWKFDGQSTTDSSGNGNNGTLVSGATFSADVPTSACVTSVAAAPTLQSDTQWVEDAAPVGAILDGNWGAASWRWDGRQKASGTQSHTDLLTDGMHQHFFYNVPLTTSPGDKLICYVLVNPCNPPREVMLQWLGPEGYWDHRAFWGENLIPWGVTGTVSRLGMGALPQTGVWVRLEVPASSVGLDGATVYGMAYTLYDGQTWFDRAGRSSGTGPAATNNASFISQTAPPLQMSPGQTASVAVTMQNTGTTTWTAANSYKLGSQNPQDNLTWGLSRVTVPTSVAPGAQVTFNFTVTAPATAGTYNFQWQMLREGVEWFGTPTTNIAVTVSSGGSGSCSQVSVFSGDGYAGYVEGLGTAARWYSPFDGLVGKDPVSGVNALFVADTYNNRIRMIYLEGASAGQSVLIAGSGTAGYWEGDGDPYQARYNLPMGLAAIKDTNGVVTTLFVVDTSNHMLRKLDRPLSGSQWRPSWLSGQYWGGYADGSADQSLFYFPRKAAVSLDGYIYVTDSYNNAIRRVDLAGNSSTLATGINTPVGITVSRTSGMLYVAESLGHSIWQIAASGSAARIAGSGTAGSADGTGAAASFNTPNYLDWANVGGSESLYIGDRLNHKIRKLGIATNAVGSYAGSGTAGYLNGGCSTARFNEPRSVAVGPAGELYVIDTANNRVRKVQ